MRNRDAERETRIRELKHQLAELSEGKLVAWESDALSSEQRENFFRDVLAFEIGPFTTDFERLVKRGVDLPSPEALEDAGLTAKLWEVIRGLAQMNVFISQTDHLNDRELYALLWHRVLRSEIPALPRDPHSAWHVNLLSDGAEEHTALYLKFYADEDERASWLSDFPEYVMPPHEDPPYDRDRHLPKRISPEL